MPNTNPNVHPLYVEQLALVKLTLNLKIKNEKFENLNLIGSY